MYSKELFRERIIALRGAKSRRVVADETGIKEVTLGTWESGRSEPNAESIAALCVAYGVSADYLLGLTDEPHGHAAAITASNSNVMSPNGKVEAADDSRILCRSCPQVEALTRVIESLAPSRLVQAPSRAPAQG